jgi:hypothetical protein
MNEMQKSEVRNQKSELRSAQRSKRHSVLLLISAFCLLTSPVFAGKFNKAVSVGDVGKSFAGLMGTDDKPHALDEYVAGGKGVVLIFTCNHCPCAAGYEERLFTLAREFQPQGIRFVAVCCGTDAVDSLPAMKVRADERKFPFPYLHDPSQQSARDYGARVTPEVFVLRPDRTIVYLGAVDDSWNDPEQVQHAYLRDALTALAAGQMPEIGEARARGCAIAYD